MQVMDILGMAQRLGDHARMGLDRPSAVPPPPAPPQDHPTLDLVAAALAGGIIAARGLTTAEEAVGVFREVREALGLISGAV